MSMSVFSIVSILVALLGVALLILAWIERSRRKNRTDFIAPIVPFLPGASAAILGIALTVLGGSGEYAAHSFGYGIAPASKGESEMKLTGRIEMTRNWALLDLDSGQTLNGQPIQGPVILMMPSGGQNATDQDRINVAFGHFGPLAGDHFSMVGIWRPTAGRQFFLVQQADQN
jgi:hypothetical protein